VAHQFFAGSGISAELSESEIRPVGGLDAVSADLLAPFHYAALGHLHCPQQLGRPSLRYAGSPLKYSASEHAHRKAAALVELDAAGACTVSLLPLVPLRDLRRICGAIHELIAAPSLPVDDYLFITLTDQEEPVDAMAKLRAVYPNIMALEFQRRQAATPEWEAFPLQREQADAAELFSAFYTQSTGNALSAAQGALIAQLLEEAEVEL
jgi:DNA repair exonuclease